MKGEYFLFLVVSFRIVHSVSHPSMEKRAPKLSKASSVVSDNFLDRRAKERPNEYLLNENIFASDAASSSHDHSKCGSNHASQVEVELVRASVDLYETEHSHRHLQDQGPYTIDVYWHTAHNGFDPEYSSMSGYIPETEIQATILKLNNVFYPEFSFVLHEIEYHPYSATDPSRDWWYGCMNSRSRFYNEEEYRTLIRDQKHGPDKLYVYTCVGDTGTLGYAHFPHEYDVDPSGDGIVFDWWEVSYALDDPNYDPSDGAVVVHEGLYHPFEGGCIFGDGIDDTDPLDSPRYECISVNTCGGVNDDFDNYMDYVFSPNCTDNLTAGQRARMVGAWNTWRNPNRAPPAVNSLCKDAILISPGDVLSGSTTNATFDIPVLDKVTVSLACAEWYSKHTPGVFYKFLGTGNGLRLSLNNDPVELPWQIAVLSGSCGNLTCNYFERNWLQGPVLDILSTVLGETYFVHISGRNSLVADFVLSVQDLPTAPPTNLPTFTPSAVTTTARPLVPSPTVDQGDTLSPEPVETNSLLLAWAERRSESRTALKSSLRSYLNELMLGDLLYSPVTQEPSTPSPTSPITYVPGDLTVQEGYLLLSTGLTSRVIAQVEEPVVYSNGIESIRPFHWYADFGATFVDDRPENPGGMIYVSNSEDFDFEWGGVGAITFDKDYNIIDYQMVLEGTTGNCGGGKTPWGSWISCEEYEWGRAWQVDPTGQRAPQVITLGSDFGYFESFAYDIRNLDDAHFYITEDNYRGPIQRFTPHNPNWQDPWTILTGSGDIHYLLLSPLSDTQGQYSWTTNKQLARNNAELHYPNCEGIDISGNQMFVVSKVLKRLFTFDLDGNTYTSKSTVSGLFDGEPDQVAYILGAQDLLYFTEDGGTNAGVHARNSLGQYFTILESPFLDDETTGLSFSPDGSRLYVAYQRTGLLFEIRRTDGYSFHASTLNVKYHATA